MHPLKLERGHLRRRSAAPQRVASRWSAKIPALFYEQPITALIRVAVAIS